MSAPGRQRSSARAQHTALLVLDLISDYRYPGGADILPNALRVARHVSQLKRRLKRRGMPCIYVNDMRGRWESDQATFLRRSIDASDAVAALIETILPARDDYFIFKPRHSAFFATPLDELLRQLQVHRLILTGITAHQCVLFTAIDAHVRGYQLIVPHDCIASASSVELRHALFILEHAVNSQLLASRYLRRIRNS